MYYIYVYYISSVICSLYPTDLLLPFLVVHLLTLSPIKNQQRRWLVVFGMNAQQIHKKPNKLKAGPYLEDHPKWLSHGMILQVTSDEGFWQVPNLLVLFFWCVRFSGDMFVFEGVSRSFS